jgi:hypothetical protein
MSHWLDGEAMSTVTRLSRFRTPAAVAGVVFIAIVHMAIVFLLYGQRVRVSFLSSEVLWLLIPAVAACVGYYAVLRRRHSVNMPSWVGAFLLTLCSLSLSVYLAFNTYGS